MPKPDGDRAAAEVYVSGLVQGVGYRFYTERIAAKLSIKGWSMNLPDGRVMLDIEGDKARVEEFITELKVGPRMARVSDVTVSWRPYQGRHGEFYIKV